MANDVSKLMELMKTDEGFRARLKEKADAYAGEKAEEPVFNGIIAPAAAEYGLTVTYADAKAYAESVKGREMDPDELRQVSGGGKGYGLFLCDGLGYGLGFAGEEDGKGWYYAGLCILGGLGQGELDCWGSGTKIT